MSLGDEDLDVFLEEFTAEVVFGAQTCKGILDAPDSTDGMHISTDYELTFKTGELSGLTYHSTIIVDGVTYRVKESPSKLDDGKFSRVFLEVP